VQVTFAIAGEADAAAIAAVRIAAARDLTARFGLGTWSLASDSEHGVRAEIVTSTVLFARQEGIVVGTLRLALRNPWWGDTSFFTPAERPVFLTAMAIAPKWQGQGIGRALLEAARSAAGDLRGEVIRLDSYDAPAGAGDFYRKCGYREMHRGDYNGTPLIWFESFL
jgi:GNAT superfamily N-acetyltransferase